MKNILLKSAFSFLLITFFSIQASAQEKMDCDSRKPLTQKICYQKLVSDIGKFITYPEEAYFNDTEGKVIVRFTTDENKQIRNISVIKASDKILAQEVIEAVHLMASEDNNYTAANQIYKIPVHFNLDEY